MTSDPGTGGPAPLKLGAPLPKDHPPLVPWQHWWWSYERPKPAPERRLIVIWDALAGHRSYHLVRWRRQHSIFSPYPPLSGSWLYLPESLQRILARRALVGPHPQTAQQVIDWSKRGLARTGIQCRLSGTASADDGVSTPAYAVWAALVRQ